jgi:hypothetical protein
MQELPHLVVARLPQQASTAGFKSANVRGVQMMLKRLFAKLPLKGRYAVSVERTRGSTEIMCVFEHERDAEEAAKAVGAAATPPYTGWQTQRIFEFDGRKQDQLSRLAGTYRHRRRRSKA